MAQFLRLLASTVLHPRDRIVRQLPRLESGSFVGRFGDQEYELGSTEAGLALAIRRVSKLQGEIQAKVA